VVEEGALLLRKVRIVRDSQDIFGEAIEGLEHHISLRDLAPERLHPVGPVELTAFRALWNAGERPPLGEFALHFARLHLFLVDLTNIRLRQVVGFGEAFEGDQPSHDSIEVVSLMGEDSKRVVLPGVPWVENKDIGPHGRSC